jgi:predicted kinase
LYHCTKRCYGALADLTRTALQGGFSVIVDATFSKQVQRAQIQALAHVMGAGCYLLECVVPEATLQARLEQRMQTPGVISDGRLEILPQFKQGYEPMAQCLQHALAAIQEGRAALDS